MRARIWISLLLVLVLAACIPPRSRRKRVRKRAEMTVWFTASPHAIENPPAKRISQVQILSQAPAQASTLLGTVYARPTKRGRVYVEDIIAEMRGLAARRGCDAIVPMGDWWDKVELRLGTRSELDAMCVIYKRVAEVEPRPRPRPKPKPEPRQVTQAVAAALAASLGQNATLSLMGGSMAVGRISSFDGTHVVLVDSMGNTRSIPAGDVVSVSVVQVNVPRVARVNVFERTRGTSEVVLRELTNEQVEVDLTTGVKVSGKVLYFHQGKLTVRSPVGDTHMPPHEIRTVFVIRNVVPPMAGAIRRYTAGADPVAVIGGLLGKTVRVSRVGGMQLLGRLMTFEGGVLMVQADGGLSQMVEVHHVATVDVLPK